MRNLPLLRPLAAALLLASAAMTLPNPLHAQLNTGYQTPPPSIQALADAPPTPGASLDPTRTTLLLLTREAYLTVAELAQPELKLAGIRANPATNGQSRSYQIRGFELVTVLGAAKRTVQGMPANPRIGETRWAADGKHFAFVHDADDRMELWVVDVATAQARKATDLPVNAFLPGASYQWHPDGKTLLVRVMPENRGAKPTDSNVPKGPAIQENMGRSAPLPTYTDMLKNAADEAKFDYYATSQLALVTLQGSVARVGQPGIYRSAEFSPDGKFVLVQAVVRPYSYLVPFQRFAQQVSIWDLQGTEVRRVADIALNETQSRAMDAVQPGPRGFGWRSDAPATVLWAVAPDNGDPTVKSDYRDAAFALSAPFTGEPIEWMRLPYRFAGVTWGDDNLALVTEYWPSQRKLRVHKFAPKEPSKLTLLEDRSYEDAYADPGDPVTVANAAGRQVLLRTPDGKSIYRIGDGARPDGVFPFLDRHNLETNKTERLLRTTGDVFEQPVALLDNQGRAIITSRESKTEKPDFYLRNLRAKVAPLRLTDLPDPSATLKGIQQEVITYQRKDGVQLSGTLYLPPNFTPGKDAPLPTLLWAYPQEFKSQQAASQVTESSNRYPRVFWGSPLFWLTRGYAVLDDPKMPIIGEGDTQPNDNYVPQLVGSAEAAINALVERKVTDPKRVAVGGHSYGAFMTANLLSHSNLFAAGIARSGAYNRTLTPFGFQAEDRSYWQAKDVYDQMSPFNFADKMKTPLLMIHGDADANMGTHTLQSERYYAALKGHGATTRLVLLPFESHGYAARENILHMLWEQDQWLERFVKNRTAQ